MSVTAGNTIVFESETTGTQATLDEAVSIAVQSYAAPNSAEIEHHTLIAPRFPEKLLFQSAEGNCAFDVHGIHPDDLAGQPTFPLVYRALSEIMPAKNWGCLLDSLCIRHRLPQIPRNRVVCAMKLLSPLAGNWDEGRAVPTVGRSLSTWRRR